MLCMVAIIEEVYVIYPMLYLSIIGEICVNGLVTFLNWLMKRQIHFHEDIGMTILKL